jgi:archaellum component FlaF (FlaF/FlaG flagellin family)
MKKILLFSTLVIASAMIYSYSQSVQSNQSLNNAKQSVSKDLKGNNKTEVVGSNAEMAYSKQVKVQESRTSILIILTADKSKPGWSSSFLKNYLFGNTNKEGC